jgi:hypothetical protein
MSNRECKWVRTRLPLWVGDGALNRDNGSNNGGDLGLDDCRQVEQHLTVCNCCCGYRLALERAFGALTAASTLTPVNPYAPSLWPILKDRIADQGVITACRRLRVISSSADWLRRKLVTRNRKQPQVGSVLVYGTVASFLIILATLSFARRQWLDAQLIITRNASPSVYVTAPTDLIDDLLLKSSDLNTELPANHLAEVGPVRLPDASAGLEPGVASRKSSIPDRLGYDLDHGTLVAPDPRESKPIY